MEPTTDDSAETRHAGPWPFVTIRYFHRDGRALVWRSRDHRKGLFRHRRALENVPAPFWQTALYNWLTGLIFVLGSALFMAGSAMALYPAMVAHLPSWTTNVTFFAGSIPFTTAAYMQLFQAANAEAARAEGRDSPALFGWEPTNAGWL
ncbi:hypothetical protein MD273_18910, partial [Marinobacter pelagius]|uniref:hypothetical protein n=1 Tax=Marinobacter sp. C7 TaxID=2951363 RepID=UPI001EF129A4